MTQQRESEIQDSVPRLLRLALALTGSMPAAEDLVQEAVAKVWDRADTVRGDLHPYLRRVLINLHHDALRRDVRKAAWTDEFERDVPASGGTDPAVRIDVERMLAALPPLQRELVVLRYYADLTFDQIADATGRPAGTIRRQCVEVLQQLRDNTEEKQ